MPRPRVAPARAQYRSRGSRLSTLPVALRGSSATKSSERGSWKPPSRARQMAEPGEQQDDDPPAASGGRHPEVDFHGEKRSNATHASMTDPDARLARKGKGKEAKLGVMGHVLMENRHGSAVDVLLTHATGTAQREAAVRMLD